ncbi:MAG: hypothetical protein PHH11_09170 [Methylomonas sp.]|nr:hypothetical protein [Methylomonas sp.]
MKRLIKQQGASEQVLLQDAKTQFALGRFKEATDLYKDLLKCSDNPDYKRRLAECYMRRALAMADKNMPKEASVLWENHAEYAEPPFAAEDAYLLWLLAGNNERKAFACLERFDTRRLDQECPELCLNLGYRLLSGQTELVAHLPRDGALLRDWEIVQQAVDAFRRGDEAACEQGLKQLPFRSAFRDLRTLFKAQKLAASALDEARALLAKIPDSSPYRSAATALSACWATGAAFVASLSDLEHGQRRLVYLAKGLRGQSLEFLEVLSKHKAQPNDKMCFDLVLQYRDIFGKEAARAYCLGALAQYPGGMKDYQKHFGTQDAFEEYRIQALLCEQGKDSYDAEFYWRRAIDILKEKGPENNKKIALILRHMAAKLSEAEMLKLLIESLDYDPDDRNSYLRILSIYQQGRPDSSQYYQWLERSLKRFPSDADLLVRAAKSAASRKAFKKATAYAKALLKIDPVNTLAKQLLFANHLAHARRMLKAKKYHLVEREILAAEQLSIDNVLRRHAELLRGFYIWLAEDKALGVQRITETLGKINADPINMQFQAGIEADMLGQAATQLIKALPACKDYLLSAPELQRLIASIAYYDEQLDDSAAIVKALDKLKAPLKKSVQWLLDHEALLVSWCGSLERIGHFDLLKQCAKLANSRRPRPIWAYFLALAECRGDAGRLVMVTLYQLQHAMDTARAENDLKTASLIGRLLERYHIARNPFPFAAEDFGDDPEYVDDDPFEVLFGHLPESIFEKIGKNADTIFRKRDIQQLIAGYIQRRGVSVDKQVFAVLSMNPEFLTCMSLVIAAEELKIDIGVSFEDVVEYFQHESPQFSLPFF